MCAPSKPVEELKTSGVTFLGPSKTIQDGKMPVITRKKLYQSLHIITNNDYLVTFKTHVARMDSFNVHREPVGVQ